MAEQKVQPADSAPAEAPESEAQRLQKEMERFKDLAYRAAADLDNFRKRVAKDREELELSVREELAASMVPVLDAFDMAAAAVDGGVAEDVRKKYIAGYEAIARQLMTALEAFGLKALDVAAGAPYDPRQHEALTTEPRAGVKSPQVAEVFQKGYQLEGRLIRPARVRVAMPQTDADSPPAQES